MEGYAITRSNAVILENIWRFKSDTGSRIYVDLFNSFGKDGMNYSFTQDRIGKEIYRDFTIYTNRTELLAIPKVNNLYLDAEKDHLYIEGDGIAVSITVRDDE